MTVIVGVAIAGDVVTDMEYCNIVSRQPNKNVEIQPAILLAFLLR